MPLLSLITITYNSAATIRATLDSIHSQTFQDFEYIVIDGASSDDTVRFIEEHPIRVDQLVSEPDSGLYDALNKGIGLATGKALGILHSDDAFYERSSLHKIANEFLEGSDACYGDLQYVAGNGQDGTERVLRHWRSGPFDRRKVKCGWMPPHPTFYMRKELFDEYGYYDASFRIAGDYDALLRYLWTFEVQPAYIPDVLVKMRFGGTSNRSIQNVYRKTMEDIRALKKNNLPWARAIVYKNVSKLLQFF